MAAPRLIIDPAVEQARLAFEEAARITNEAAQKRMAEERALLGKTSEEWAREPDQIAALNRMSVSGFLEYTNQEWNSMMNKAQSDAAAKAAADATAQRVAEEQAAAFASAEAARVAASAEQQRIISGIVPEAEAMRTSLLGQTEADRARVEALVTEYTKPVDTTARRTAEQEKITLQTEQAITEAGKKVRSEAAIRGGLYGGGYIGAMSEALVVGELSKVTRMADFEERLAKEQEEKGKLGLSYTMELYKTHAQSVFQAYQTAYNITMEKAKMAQQAGQFDVQLAWEQQGTQIDQAFKTNLQNAQIVAQERQAQAERELKLLLTKRDELQRELDRAFTAGENAKARDLQLQIAKINADAAGAQADATASAGLWGGIGTAIGVGGALLI